MPWCPRCVQEYESHVTHCADCGAALVPDPPADESSKDPTGPEEVIRSHDREILEQAVQHLASCGIPAQVVPVPPEDDLDTGFALVVPAAAWRHAVHSLRPFLSALPNQDGPDLRPLLPETLNLPLSEIIDRGPELLADLVKGLFSDNPSLRTKCEYALLQIGEPACTFLTDVLLDAIRADDPRRVRHVCRPLAQYQHPGPLHAVRGFLNRREHLIPAITALGYLDDPAAVPDLVRLLEDNDPSVRDEAAESLYNITGKSFDFEAEDPPELRSRAVEAWNRWMHWRNLA